jgi:hypothetical protein
LIEKYENSPFMKNIKEGDSFGIRKKYQKSGILREDAEILVGNRNYPLIARRQIKEGWVYCINVSAYISVPEKKIIKNLIE